jgi:hypothetical protein
LPGAAGGVRSSWPGGVGSASAAPHNPLALQITGRSPWQQQGHLVWSAPGDTGSDPGHPSSAAAGRHAHAGLTAAGPPAEQQMLAASRAAAGVGAGGGEGGAAEHAVHGRSAGPRSSGGTVYCSASSAGSSVLADLRGIMFR